jgi:hypothetical protein
LNILNIYFVGQYIYTKTIGNIFSQNSLDISIPTNNVGNVSRNTAIYFSQPIDVYELEINDLISLKNTIESIQNGELILHHENPNVITNALRRSRHLYERIEYLIDIRLNTPPRYYLPIAEEETIPHRPSVVDRPSVDIMRTTKGKPIRMAEKECPVCYNNITKYKSVRFNCHHTLCSVCIMNIIHTDYHVNKFVCPCCRANVTNMQVTTKTLKNTLDKLVK